MVAIKCRWLSQTKVVVWPNGSVTLCSRPLDQAMVVTWLQGVGDRRQVAGGVVSVGRGVVAAVGDRRDVVIVP